MWKENLDLADKAHGESSTDLFSKGIELSTALKNFYSDLTYLLQAERAKGFSKILKWHESLKKYANNRSKSLEKECKKCADTYYKWREKDCFWLPRWEA
jgi:hypothetical protein